MEESINKAKNYDAGQEYYLHAYVDCKDTVNNWCVGQIVDYNENNGMIKVHFEGWTPRYDEVSSNHTPWCQLLTFTIECDEKEFLEDRTLQALHRRIHRAEEERVQRLQDQLHVPQPGKRFVI